MTTDLLLLPAFYLLGCLTMGYYLVRFIDGSDIRVHGSGSTGARNVSRVLGPWGFISTAAWDLAKGFFAISLAQRYGHSEWLAPVAVVITTIGHVFPVQLRFKGGKGVMTAAGGLLLLDPLLMGVFAALLLPVLLVLRRLTLSGMIIVAFSPIIALVLGRPPMILTMLCALTVVILFAHRENLRDELGLIRSV